MPRPRKTSSEQPVIPTTALVASATRYTGKSPARIYRPNQQWQIECYRHYAICGEARYAARYYGHALSRAVLGVAKSRTDEWDESGEAYDLLTELFHGKEGQKEMLEACGVHLTIAGECFLIGRQVDGIDVWEICSIIEVVVNGTTWQINYQDGRPPVTLEEDDVAIRIWLPDPAKKMEADSPFKALLPILGEIEWLTKHVFAQVQSRLAGAGILLLPQEISFPPAPAGEEGQAVDTTDNPAAGFMMVLADEMIRPIEDPSSPSSLVPIVATVPMEALGKSELIKFWSELDAESKELRNEAIRRFALGVDMPPEVLLGMSSNGGTGGGSSNGVSHWGAWQIEESTIKLHIEPMLDVVCNALTIGYLRPGMGGENGSEVIEVVVYSTAALRLRPDRSKEAFELYDRGLLKAKRLLEENGFSEEDMPDDEEFRRWLTIKVAGGSTTPDQVGAAAGLLGLPLPAATPELPVGNEERPDPSLDDHPTRPRTPDESALPALYAAADALVYRALERAGNRLRQQGVKPQGVPSYETHLYASVNGNADALLDDAWSCAGQVLSEVTPEPAKVIDTLHRYTTSLLQTGNKHTREAMEVWLS